MRLNDNSIAHIAKIIQMAILTGTDIVDHLRMVRFTANEEDVLSIEEEYEKVFSDSIEKMMQNIPQGDSKPEEE